MSSFRRYARLRARGPQGRPRGAGTVYFRVWLGDGSDFRRALQCVIAPLCLLLVALQAGAASEAQPPSPGSFFNVKTYGASGRKEDDARPAIQRAIDACAAAGGGVVCLPAGIYTSGTLRLRSHVVFRIEAGATLLAARDPEAYDCGPIVSKAALLYGEQLEDVSLEGGGIIDGQAEYEWRPDDFEEAFDHKTIMQQLGKPLLRSFPKGFPQRKIYPHLVWLGNCRNVRVKGLKFYRSPSWTIALYGCEQAHFEGLYLDTSLKEAVWADGIDLDSCRDVVIANCRIATGDDCIALISTSNWGPARVCENVSVTNCQLSSASAGIKFSEGNVAGIRNVHVSNTRFNNVNRGVVIFTALGGAVSNVTLADLEIHCNRFDWFWAGDGQPFRFRTVRVSEWNEQPPLPGEAPPGLIRDITIRNVVAHAKGSSLFHGHPERPLEEVRLENVRLFLAADPSAAFDLAEHALDFRRVNDLSLTNVEVHWQSPPLARWKNALHCEEISRLKVTGLAGRGARTGADAAAVWLQQIAGAEIRGCRALSGTDVFFRIAGPATRNVQLGRNDLGAARIPCQLDADLARGAVVGFPPTSLARQAD